MSNTNGKSNNAAPSGRRRRSRNIARWEYENISLEFSALLRHGENFYEIPSYAGEGLGHMHFKIVVAAHLLHWGYKWEEIQWEYDPLDVPGRQRADIFAKSNSSLPRFWFECGSTDKEKLRKLRSALPLETRLVNVIAVDWFLRSWNGKYLELNRSLPAKERREVIRNHRSETTVAGVEYWAIYEMSTSARILFAVRCEGDNRYTYFDTSEGWSLSHVTMLSRRTDSWTALIPGIVGGESSCSFDSYLPRNKIFNPVR